MLTRIIARYTRPYTVGVICVIVLQLVATLAALYLPSLNAQIIDRGVSRGDTDVIWSIGGVMLLICLVQAAAAICAVYFGSRVSMSLGRDLRRDVFARVSGFSATQLGRFGAPTLITRGTNDVQQVQILTLMLLNMMVSTPIMCIGGIVMALREDVGLSWLVWVSVAVLGVVVGLLVSLLIPLFRTMQERIDGINGILREQLIGVRVIRAFVRERYERARFADANTSLTGVSVRVGNVFVLMFPIIMMILHLATAAVLWFGAHRIDTGEMQVGALTAFLQYLLQILVAVMMATFMAMMVPRAVVSAERVSEVLAVGTDVTSEGTGVDVPVRGRLEFHDVVFGYTGAEKPVVQGVSFTAEPGTTTAIIGSTGAGKSTLLKLADRLYAPDSGRILLDGAPLEAYTREQLASRIGYVPQRPYLFSGTVASNLRFGAADADDDRLWAALRVAQADDFVSAMPEGVDGPISQGGTNVSGGQRQRLSIARALVVEPAVYLFDDSFSALDVATDARLRSALVPVTRSAAVIIVAQRISTIRGADQIIVVDDGQVVGRGTHEELLESNATYREIHTSQLSAEEVA
ncbi:ABC transporter ATP-binding protein [Mycetocola reblochoni]|uniref:Lipid A export ATP-binding/permease protein MsbA n=2 Tax=Mycetocola reblochoni TaxID=331618 RepID=A0A1R4J8S7_9MICO|nr:ABC transporter ATP-binding protein [Mycetocola reblochoni]RLP70099.1 ABC transporter ATP-binding protein [Mycetocola reblochoni]SJN28531.1 Lipid A export ATP-binding/permease protein MsbA [Mycetocola reblochoni REB411]